MNFTYIFSDLSSALDSGLQKKAGDHCAGRDLEPLLDDRHPRDHHPDRRQLPQRPQHVPVCHRDNLLGSDGLCSNLEQQNSVYLHGDKGGFFEMKFKVAAKSLIRSFSINNFLMDVAHRQKCFIISQSHSISWWQFSDLIPVQLPFQRSNFTPNTILETF